jgi:hypothetical protein
MYEHLILDIENVHFRSNYKSWFRLFNSAFIIIASFVVATVVVVVVAIIIVIMMIIIDVVIIIIFILLMPVIGRRAIGWLEFSLIPVAVIIVGIVATRIDTVI